MNIPTMLWTLLYLGQTAPGGAGAVDPAEAVKVQSIWDFVVKGGPMMIPIGLCSLVALTVIIERLVSLRRRRVIPPAFLPEVKKTLGEGDNGRTDALEFCGKDGSPIANIFAAGIKRLDDALAQLETHVQEAGQREMLKLRKYSRVLVVIASIAPLMGLLGTIFGMINAFQTVAMSSEALGKAELLAKGIYEAMITTAAGLMVTIPVLIAYHWIFAKVDRLVAEMDQMAVDFIEQYARPRVAAGKHGPRLQPVEDSEIQDETEEDAEPAAATA